MSQLLKTKTGNQVVVEGHTDNTGTDSLNQPLSDERARGIQKALVDHGVPVQRMSAVGDSSKRPIAANSSEEGRSLNRRVELVVIDEKVENITRGEPSNAFESTFAQIKTMVDKGLVRPPESKQ